MFCNGLPTVGKKIQRSEKLLTMETVMLKTPWDVLLLLGGGYAIAEGCEVRYGQCFLTRPDADSPVFH